MMNKAGNTLMGCGLTLMVIATIPIFFILLFLGPVGWLLAFLLLMVVGVWMSVLNPRG